MLGFARTFRGACLGACKVEIARAGLRWLRLYAELGLNEDDAMLALATRLLAKRDERSVTAWCEIAVLLADQRRKELLRMLLRFDGELVVPSRKVAEQIGELNEIATEEQFGLWIQLLVGRLLRGESVDYLIAGLGLAKELGQMKRLGELALARIFPEELVGRLAITLARQPTVGWVVMALWQRCGHVVAFSKILRKVKWRKSAPDQAAQYLGLFAGWDGEISDRTLQEKWQRIAEELPALDDLLATVPIAYRNKVIAFFGDWFCNWDDPKRIKKQMTAGLALARRLAKQPFSEQENAAGPLGALLEIRSDAGLQELVGCARSQFRHVGTSMQAE